MEADPAHVHPQDHPGDLLRDLGIGQIQAEDRCGNDDAENISHGRKGFLRNHHQLSGVHFPIDHNADKQAENAQNRAAFRGGHDTAAQADNQHDDHQNSPEAFDQAAEYLSQGGPLFAGRLITVPMGDIRYRQHQHNAHQNAGQVTGHKHIQHRIFRNGCVQDQHDPRRDHGRNQCRGCGNGG